MALAVAALVKPDDSQPSGLPDKTLGQFSEIPTSNYEGSYRPARMALTKLLGSDKMRNPLQMHQSAAPWSARRPLSAGTTQPARAASAGRVRPQASSSSGTFGGIGAAEKAEKRGPGMLQPQRIELPGYLNTPSRRPDGEPASPEERTLTIRKIQDLELLTFACRRASKVREEGRAHFSMGVLRDNLGQYQKAIDSYNQFLRVCKECNDGQGCALAYHCIAVDHQLLGGALVADTTSTAAGREAVGISEVKVKPDVLRKAIFFHNKHRENSDSVGKFVAHLNMGLAYAQLGEREASTVNHQYALRYALQLHSLEGQSLAIGSLGFSAGMYDNDPEKMRVLIERYVHLCDTLKQPRNQASALKKLGIIASQQGESEQSIQYFQQALDCAKATGDREAEKDCSVRLGIAAGQAKMADHISTILQSSVMQA
jgi:tetratricopeptide (TPR) repeat protein